MTTVEQYIFIPIIIIILLVQSTLLFIDAKKNGELCLVLGDLGIDSISSADDFLFAICCVATEKKTKKMNQ